MGLCYNYILKTIFYISNNTTKHVILYVELNRIFQKVKENPKTEITVNLEKQSISVTGTNLTETFEIDPYKKTCMINGYDDIDYLLSKKDRIEAFEAQKI